MRHASPSPVGARAVARDLALFLVAGLSLAALAGCTFTPEGGDTLEETVYLYRSADPDKALAVAAAVEGNRGRRAWGVATGHLTQDAANEKALESCTRNAQRASLAAECHLFAVGDSLAPETVAACREGRLDSYRCELQRRHADELGGGPE